MKTKIASLLLALTMAGCADVRTRQTVDGGTIISSAARDLITCQLQLDTYAGHHVQMIRERNFTGSLGVYGCAAYLPKNAPTSVEQQEGAGRIL